MIFWKRLLFVDNWSELNRPISIGVLGLRFCCNWCMWCRHTRQAVTLLLVCKLLNCSGKACRFICRSRIVSLGCQRSFPQRRARGTCRTQVILRFAFPLQNEHVEPVLRTPIRLHWYGVVQDCWAKGLYRENHTASIVLLAFCWLFVGWC